jgi:hypothetical protein
VPFSVFTEPKPLVIDFLSARKTGELRVRMSIDIHYSVRIAIAVKCMLEYDTVLSRAFFWRAETAGEGTLRKKVVITRPVGAVRCVYESWSAGSCRLSFKC